MIAFCIAWGLLLLLLRLLGMVRVLGIAGCISEGGFPVLTESDMDERSNRLIARELWFNSAYFALAVMPLFFAVQQSSFKSTDLAVVCSAIILSYGFFHLWLQKVLLHNGRITKALTGLYERVSKPFLILSKFEESIGMILLGDSTGKRVHKRLKEYMLRTSISRAKQQDEQDLEHDEREILRQLDGLFETCIENVMTPFSRVITFRENLTIMEALENARLHGYSRYPVVTEDHKIVGVFRANQLILLNHLGELVKDHMDELITMNPGSCCYEALEIFQKSKRQFAIVNTAGSHIGVLTIEDILEELVGEIEDEFDQSNLKKISGDTYLVDAVMDLEEFVEYFNLSLSETRSKTVNGFLLEYCGGIPHRGTLISLKGLRILILEADARKISRLRVTQTSLH